MTLQIIWQSNKHCAFTDLVYYNQTWYCVFREGSTHMSLDGRIVVLTSHDAVSWQKHSVLSWQGGDLRDPKLSVAPNNSLIMSAGIRWSVYNTASSRFYSVVWQMEINDWSEPILDSTSEGTWRWATTWHQGKAYSVGYAGNDINGCLYRSENGLHWQKWVENFFPDSNIFTNESSLVSYGETLWCLSRRDGKDGGKAVLGCATGQLKHWQWHPLAKHIGGPKWIQLSNGEFLVAGRFINFKRWTAKTRVYKLSPHTGRLKLWRELPSSGDCGYPGMVEKDGVIYVSYYASYEENQAGVYFAVIPLKTKKRSRRFR